MSMSLQQLMDLEARIEAHRYNARRFAQLAELSSDPSLKSIFEGNRSRHEKWLAELTSRLH